MFDWTHLLCRTLAGEQTLLLLRRGDDIGPELVAAQRKIDGLDLRDLLTVRRGNGRQAIESQTTRGWVKLLPAARRRPSARPDPRPHRRRPAVVAISAAPVLA